MDTERPREGVPGRVKGRGAWAGAMAVAVLPVILAVLGYYRPWLRGEPVERMWLDVPFAAYQLSHVSELGGRWWKVADDDRAGAPYQTEAAKNPSLYEGLDVMLLATVAARMARLDPARHYDLAVLAVLAANGWVAAWLVRRQTGSWLWAAVAVSLITLNYPTEWRITSGHNHILKYGWALAAVAAFGAYLRSPDWRRGAVLGLAVAWQLQGSFYQGFLLGLGLALAWAGMAVSGRVGRRHLGATVTAGLTFGLAASAFAFPVVTVARSAVLADGFFQRTKRDVWAFGSELWQYAVPPDSPAALKYVAEVGHKELPYHFEGWAFPGYAVLLAVVAFLAARSRGWRPDVSDPRELDLWLGLGAVFGVLSLAGGPSLALFEVFPTFRCYGRASLLVLALGCVAAPVIAQALIGLLKSRGLRAAATTGVLALVAYDGYQAVKSVPNGGYPSHRRPAWSDWLERQPRGVNLVALATLPDPGSAYYSWGMTGLMDRPGPGHQVLNGAEFQLLSADLALLGATHDRINPAALKFLVSLGYEALAFDAAYLDRNPWLRSEPGLRLAEVRGGWSVYRAGPELTRYPTTTPERLLAARPTRPAPDPVPPDCWVTGGLDVDDDVVVARGGGVLLQWADAEGRTAGSPRRALLQHVFGKDIPAYTVLTPMKPGKHVLIFTDARGRRLAEKGYTVDPSVLTIASLPPGQAAEISARTDPGPTREGMNRRVRVLVENRTPYFVQAQTNRWAVPPSIRPHPAYGATGPGSLSLSLSPTTYPSSLLLLPRDLPPGGRLALDLPADLFLGPPADALTGLSPFLRFLNVREDGAAIGARRTEGVETRR